MVLSCIDDIVSDILNVEQCRRKGMLIA